MNAKKPWNYTKNNTPLHAELPSGIHFLSTSGESFVHVNMKSYWALRDKKFSGNDMVNSGYLVKLSKFPICFYESSISWNEAYTSCKSKDVDLPSINSYKDMLDFFRVNFLDDRKSDRWRNAVEVLYEKIGLYIGFNLKVSINAVIISFHEYSNTLLFL